MDELDRQSRRLASAWMGMVGKQRSRLLREIEIEGRAQATSDGRARYEAAQSLVRTGQARAIFDGQKYVCKGIVPSTGKRRQRDVIVIVAPAAREDERI